LNFKQATPDPSTVEKNPILDLFGSKSLLNSLGSVDEISAFQTADEGGATGGDVVTTPK